MEGQFGLLIIKKFIPSKNKQYKYKYTTFKKIKPLSPLLLPTPASQHLPVTQPPLQPPKPKQPNRPMGQFWLIVCYWLGTMVIGENENTKLGPFILLVFSSQLQASQLNSSVPILCTLLRHFVSHETSWGGKATLFLILHCWLSYFSSSQFLFCLILWWKMWVALVLSDLGLLLRMWVSLI